MAKPLQPRKTTQFIKLFVASGVRQAGGLTWKSHPRSGTEIGERSDPDTLLNAKIGQIQTQINRH